MSDRQLSSFFALALGVGLSVASAGCTDKKEEAPVEAAAPAAEADPVTLDLWSGVPDLQPHPGDVADVIVPRPGPEKPETVSESIELPFPPEAPSTASKPEVVTGPLAVERFGPTGEQTLVDAVRVTFNHPMVPLASVEQLATKTVPFEIEPKTAGKVRWLGTRTVAFYPEGRMPFSTEYKVRVPKGVKSTGGSELASEHTFAFSTPALALASAYPYDGATGIELEPLLTLTFNQPVQRTALLAALEWKGGGKTVEFTETEPVGAATMEAWQRDRLVVLKPKGKLSPDTTYKVSLPAGVFGEGPRKSSAISFAFSTYPPLTLSKTPCYGVCWASNGISLTASNSITDIKVEEKVHVTPAVENISVTSGYNGIQISGDFVGDTTYAVTVDAGLEDMFHQTLAKPFKTTVKLGPQYPQVALKTMQRNPAVIERGAPREIELAIAGIDTLEIEARALDTTDVPQFLDAYSYDGMWGWPEGVPGSTFEKAHNVRPSRKKKQDFLVELDAILGKKNIAWLIARSNKIKIDDWETKYGISQMALITDLGVAAAIDRDSGLVQVTRLSTGEPISGVELEIVQGAKMGTRLWSGTTDADGLARPTYTTAVYGDHLMVVAKHEGDVSFLRLDQNDLRGQWRNWGTPEDTSKAFFFTDRAPYKPGETIHLVGVLRQETRGPKGAVQWWRQNATAKYKVVDPRGIDVASGDVKIGAFGTLAVDIETKDEGGTGNYQFTLEVPALFGPTQTFWHGISVETYRTPEFTVKVERPESKALVFGDKLHADIIGEYLHGAPLVGGQVAYTLTRSTASFTPPGSENDGFTFGSGNQWGYGWYGGGGRGRHYGGEYWGGGYSTTINIENKTGTLDVTGKYAVEHVVVAKEPPPPGTPVPAVPSPPSTEPEGPPQAATYTIAATVTDENRQAIASSGNFIVHPARVYVGLRSDRTVVREGEQVDIQAVLVDLEGARKSGSPIALEFVRKETTRKAVEKNGAWMFEYETKEIAAGSCALTADAAPQSCPVTPDKAGSYTARASAKDDEGHETKSEIVVYVHGKDEVIWDQEDRRVDLVADKRKYAPGDTAKILLRSPFTDARGVVVVEREGISSELPVVITGGAHAVEIPITEEMVGGVSLSAMVTRGRVEIAGAPKGQDLGMPAVAVGQLELDVSTDAKTIAVELTPHAKEIEPKGSLSLTIKTTRKDSGAALPAAVAVMVVDEGVLSLMGFQTPNPVSFFHYRRAGEVWLHALHANLLPRDDAAIVAAATAPGFVGGVEQRDAYGVGGLGLVGTGRGGGGTGEGTIGLGNIGVIGKGGGDMAAPAPSAAPVAEAAAKPKAARASSARAPMADEKSRERRAEYKAEEEFDVGAAMAQQVSLRTVFATTAFFDAEILTDENGEARIDIPMPENLTTFRIMAVAIDPAAADRFGSGESSVKVRKPVMIRPSLPRFANFGDEFQGSVMVDNQTGEGQRVLVGTRGLNVKLSGETETFVDIPAGESREVRFPMAVEQVGHMRLQFAAMSNRGRDATEITIPVHYPATAEAFADYGMTDDAVQRVIEPPADALPAFGGLELSFSSTALSGLEDAVEYLVDYPYECAEQTASRILPIFALGDILDQFPIATVRDAAARKQLGADGIEKLWSHQLHDGGFGYWDTRESWPYLTNWVTFALLEGKRQGFTVDNAKLERALQYLENFAQYGYRSRWGDYYDWTSRAFSLWLLSGEKRGESLFDNVWAHRKEMPLYARVLMMSAGHRYGKTAARDEVMKELADGVIEAARTIHFAEGKSEAASDGLRLLMHSSVQTDAIALMALLEIDPSDTRLSKIIAGIMDDRDPKRGGRWTTTHSNAWSLVAASRYFEVVEKDEPDYTARVWIDSLFAGEHAFKGRSMTKVEQKVSMDTLLGAPTRQLTIGKEGPGKLYYRLGLRYAPASLKLKAQDQGFTVYREYEALPGNDGKVDPDAVKQTEDGEWIVKAGTNVKVTINLVVNDRANYVVVDDPLPAGFEGQNPKFLTSVQATSEAGRDPGYGGGYGGYPYYGGYGDGWWWGWWYTFSHTDLRDDRMLLFADQLGAGVYTYSYTARATTIGEFLLPPVKAEEMYEPERFGHGSSSKVTVVE